jgi:glycosyltransferase involved in cell wall biosynthesis
VVVPAHDEERVIARCLEALLRDARPGELEIVVVCNGCTDRTADVAREFGDAVRVLETPTGSKILALNMGDAAATAFPRIYQDADVVLTTDGVRRIAAVLRDGPALAAAPSMDMDLSAASWPVRAYYDVWARLPYTREGMIGVGTYALSREGRARFDEFPDVVADDGYVRMLFTADERVKVDGARVRVTAPAELADLIRIKTRSRLGGYELRTRFPDLVRREQAGKSYGGALGVVVARPWLWVRALAYLWVNVAARLRAGRQLRSGEAYVWERDRSSR